MILKWIMVLAFSFLTIQAGAEELLVLKNQNDKMGYGIGADVGRNLKRQGIEIDADAVAKGLKDVHSAEKLLYSETDLQAAMAAFHVELGWKGAQPKKAPPDVSYGMGVDTARVLKLYEIKVDVDLIIRGLKDVISSQRLSMGEEDLRAAMAALQLRMKQNHPKISKVKRDDKRQSEVVFMDANKKKEGVVTLPSGLQYKILKAGDGKKPADTDTVEVHYRGTFIGGEEFCNSSPGGKPATFKVTEAIPGWREALKLMPAGSRWQIFIPSNLAFRARGWGLSGWPTLPLIFELELLAVK